MYLRPKNRHILVQPVDSDAAAEQTTPSFVLPDTYQKKDDHVVAKVLEKADDCTLTVSIGDTILVPSNMLLDISHDKTQFQIVLENYVLGVLYRDR